jgi:hypothetical protein
MPSPKLVKPSFTGRPSLTVSTSSRVIAASQPKNRMHNVSSRETSRNDGIIVRQALPAAQTSFVFAANNMTRR